MHALLELLSAIVHARESAQLTNQDDRTHSYRNQPGILYVAKQIAWSPKPNHRIPCTLPHTLGKVQLVTIRRTLPNSNFGGSHTPDHRFGSQGTLIQSVFDRSILSQFTCLWQFRILPNPIGPFP